MRRFVGRTLFTVGLANTLVVCCLAQDDAAELAKQTQNPVANLISLPLQMNFNLGAGPKDDLQYVLNIQPVYPTKLSDKWNLINRMIAPVMYQPELAPGVGEEWGLGDIVYEGFFSPLDSKTVTWGIGPIIQFPTATDPIFGADEWALGPALVALVMPGQWVIGATAYNVWSVDADPGNDVNFFLFQYFINYNLPSGAYLTSAPILTSNWEAESDNQWTIPFGLGAGKVFTVGKQPINTSLHAYYNVEKPELAGDWQIRLQIQFLFPK